MLARRALPAGPPRAQAHRRAIFQARSEPVWSVFPEGAENSELVGGGAGVGDAAAEGLIQTEPGVAEEDGQAARFEFVRVRIISVAIQIEARIMAPPSEGNAAFGVVSQDAMFKA